MTPRSLLTAVAFCALLPALARAQPVVRQRDDDPPPPDIQLPQPDITQNPLLRGILNTPVAIPPPPPRQQQPGQTQTIDSKGDARADALGGARRPTPEPTRAAPTAGGTTQTGRGGNPFSWLGALFRPGSGTGGRGASSRGGAEGETKVAGAPVAAGSSESSSPTAQTSSRAVSKAQQLADSFKNSLHSAENVPAGAGGGETAASAAAWLPSGGTGDPAHPKTDADLRVAAQSGFKASFAAAGLKAGIGPNGSFLLLDAQGRPASDAERERLRRQIASDPEALLRYPDLFATIPRERYTQLKSDFETRPERRDSLFKDIGLTERKRDFDWTRTCAKISGDCNKHVKSESYKKGDLVPPDDLDSLWKDAEGQAASEQAVAGLQGHRIKGVRLPTSDGGGAAARGGGAAAAVDGGAPQLAAAVGWRTQEGSARGGAATRSGPGLALAEPPGALEERATRRPALILSALSLGLAALLGGWLLSRRRRREHGED